jgi:hypothetical protein
MSQVPLSVLASTVGDTDREPGKLLGEPLGAALTEQRWASSSWCRA